MQAAVVAIFLGLVQSVFTHGRSVLGHTGLAD